MGVGCRSSTPSREGAEVLQAMTRPCPRHWIQASRLASNRQPPGDNDPTLARNQLTPLTLPSTSHLTSHQPVGQDENVLVPAA